MAPQQSFGGWESRPVSGVTYSSMGMLLVTTMVGSRESHEDTGRGSSTKLLPCLQKKDKEDRWAIWSLLTWAASRDIEKWPVAAALRSSISLQAFKHFTSSLQLLSS